MTSPTAAGTRASGSAFPQQEPPGEIHSLRGHCFISLTAKGMDTNVPLKSVPPPQLLWVLWIRVSHEEATVGQVWCMPKRDRRISEFETSVDYIERCCPKKKGGREQLWVSPCSNHLNAQLREDPDSLM